MSLHAKKSLKDKLAQTERDLTVELEAVRKAEKRASKEES